MRDRTLLIFNASAGKPAESAVQLVEILHHLQRHGVTAEVILAEPGLEVAEAVRAQVESGVRRVIVSGGDGTIAAVAAGVLGGPAVLGIIPTGTRNNLARSLEIPMGDVGQAVAVIAMGTTTSMDVGQIRGEDSERTFLEAGIVGLASALYPAADEIQHGDLGRIGEFVSTLVSATPSEIHLRLDGGEPRIVAQAHMVIVANTPYMGASFQVAADVSCHDRYFDVFVYSELNKRELIGEALKGSEQAPDDRILRYRARSVEIITKPSMPASADGIPVGEGTVRIDLLPDCLNVMAGPPPVPVEPASAAPESPGA